MLYREAGQFKTSYVADQQIFPILQDRIAISLLLVVAFVIVVVVIAIGFIAVVIHAVLSSCRSTAV